MFGIEFTKYEISIRFLEKLY